MTTPDPSRLGPWLIAALPLLLAGASGCARCDGDVLCAVGDELPWGLLSVRAVAPDDVIVTGSSPDPADGQGAAPGPAALHWDGAAWTQWDTGPWDGAELWWVWADATEAVFVGNQGIILELDRASGAFTAVEGPDERTTFFGVWGASGDDLWAVGQTDAAAGPPALWRRQSGTWAAWEDPVLGPGTPGQVYFKVHGRAADDLWIVGTGGLALRWDGAALSVVPTNADLETATAPLLTVDASGDRVLAVGGAGNGLLLAWDGAAWRDESPEFQPGFNGVCGRGADALVVGQAAARVQLGAQGWESDLDRGIEVFTRNDWHACDLDDDGGAWMVGGRIGSRPMGAGVVGYAGAGSPDAITPEVRPSVSM